VDLEDIHYEVVLIILGSARAMSYPRAFLRKNNRDCLANSAREHR